MQTLMFVALTAALWSFAHSLLITHSWQRWQKDKFPSLEPWSRLIYVVFNTLSLGALFFWWRSLPQTVIWSWDGPWLFLQWAGILMALVFFGLGAAAYDNRAFLGFRQVANHLRGTPGGEPVFSRSGVLGWVRHPWYSGTLLFFVFCLPVTDVNLVWRGVFLLYTLIGTEIEERKLVVELGRRYAEYRGEVGRFFPKGKKE